VHWMPKFGHFQIAHKIWGRLNAWKGRYVDLAAKRGLFALLDRSRYVLRLGMARVAHFVLQDLGGLATLFSDRSTALFSDRTGTSDGFPLSLPWPAGLPSFVRIGPRLLSMLRLGISSASPCSA
jgi:hypothetical protein